MTSITSTAASSTAATTATSTSSATSSSTASTTSYASTDVTSIDWDGIIEASYEAKLARADTLDTKITANEAKISAYTEAQTLLSTLTDAAEALRAPSGTIDSADDVFLGRTAYLTAVGDVTTSSTVSVTCTSGADTGTYSLTVSQLAQAQKVASSSYASSSTDLSLSGSFEIGIDGGTSATIAVDSSTSLTDLAGKINDVSDTTGVQASVLKVSSSEYQLILSTVDTGETLTTTDTDGILSSLGVLSSDGSFTDELQASQQAIFALDGVSITRSTNDVDDVLDGVTLHLYSTTPTDTSVTVEIGQNLSDIKDAIVAFVDAYNAYRDWAVTQQETSTDGTASSDAVLFGDSTIRGINLDIADALGTSIDETSLATLGITFDDTNHLSYDEDTLDDALLADPDQVEALFAYTFDSSSTDLRLLARGTSAPSSFTIDVTTDSDGNLTGASIGGDSSLFTISGHRIIGADGTKYAGYSFVYTGDTSQAITVTQTSGIAEKLYNIADTASDSDTGSLETAITGLTDQDTTYQDQIDDIEARATTYKTNLTARYAKIQAAISTAESTLNYLQAMLDAQNSSS